MDVVSTNALSIRRRVPSDMEVDSWTAPCGWKLRSFRLPAETADGGEILFLSGRGDFLEKYLEAFDGWRNAGWTVSGFDWRGQGGSGRTHHSNACHIDDFETFVADLETFASSWRSKGKGPHVAIAHSMGAHVLLKAVATDRLSLDAMVLLSPMLGIRAGPLRGKAIRALGLIGQAELLRRRPIWTGQRSPAPGRVTSCPERQADKFWWKSVQPELGRGGPTWGWLAAANRSIAELEKTLRKRTVTHPGLLLAAADDPIVDPVAIDRTARLLPAFEYRLIQSAGHELLRERDGPRHECERRIAKFLESTRARNL